MPACRYDPNDRLVSLDCSAERGPSGQAFMHEAMGAMQADHVLESQLQLTAAADATLRAPHSHSTPPLPSTPRSVVPAPHPTMGLAGHPPVSSDCGERAVASRDGCPSYTITLQPGEHRNSAQDQARWATMQHQPVWKPMRSMPAPCILGTHRSATCVAMVHPCSIRTQCPNPQERNTPKNATLQAAHRSAR